MEGKNTSLAIISFCLNCNKAIRRKGRRGVPMIVLEGVPVMSAKNEHA